MRNRRILLVVLAVPMLMVGAQALLLPQTFFDDFPVGRAWVSLEGGPYNEHLVRDVGGLYLALAVIAFAIAWRGSAEAIRAVAIGLLATGLPHFAYHALHLDGMPGGDATVQMVLLDAQVVGPLILALAPVRAEAPEPVS